MKTYKQKSSAVRAAKKEMGEKWAEFAEIAPQGDEFVIVLKATPAIQNQIAPESIKSTIDAVALLAANDEEIALKAEKKAEIESRKPIHSPKLPSHIIVASESAPDSAPSLPAFMKKAPPAELEVPEEARQGDKLANLEAVNKDSAKPRLSSCEKPTKKVWHIADAMVIAAKEAGLPFPKRKDVVEECVRQGIAYGTSRTQFQHWFKCYNDSVAAPIATIGKDGKIVPPTK